MQAFFISSVNYRIFYATSAAFFFGIHIPFYGKRRAAFRLLDLAPGYAKPTSEQRGCHIRFLFEGAHKMLFAILSASARNGGHGHIGGR